MNNNRSAQRPAVLITGSAIRLGRAIALAFADAGYDIALHYNRSSGPAVETAAEVRQRGVDCALFALELAAAERFSEFIATVRKTFPRLTVLVNSASSYSQATISATTIETFDQQLTVNLRAPFFLTQAFAQQVEVGQVINIIDNKIAFNQFEYAAYLLSKKALAEFTRIAAIEFAPRIRINGVAPGVVLPAKTRSDAYIQWRIQGIPLQMQGETTHITTAILSLVDNPFVTGQILVVDGGESLTNVGQNAAQFDQNQV